MSWSEAGTAGSASDADEISVRPPEQAPEPEPAQGVVRQYRSRDAWVIVAHGEYDMGTVAPLADALNAAVSKHSKVVLDTSGVSFADSSFLNLLILAHQAATLFVVGPRPQLQRLFEISGVDALLRVRATVEEAVAS
ncbi:STAS domain-containing protein [Streptomyces sp. NBC_01166]|uniref:STAS domain-containing protein n=1 Tax=Streptomyces sp. NBC_01166 TaxID=2903755 RepID=UPI00386C786C|nr:STAS domain-containing protein [Streptomyces sp. NBC_01166]